jgi:hypothetical protein
MSVAAMTQALEALEGIGLKTLKMQAAIDALRQAIAEAEQPWVKTYCGNKPNYTLGPCQRHGLDVSDGGDHD